MAISVLPENIDIFASANKSDLNLRKTSKKN